jgi:hypothetical protein
MTAATATKAQYLTYEELVEAVPKELRGGEPIPLLQVLENLSSKAQFDDLDARRAIWSLIAKHELELTDDWRLMAR